MTTDFPEPFAQQYKTHLKHLKLKGLQPKTIDAPLVFIGYGLHHWIPIQWLALHAMLIILTLCVALAAYIIADRTAPEPPETY